MKLLLQAVIVNKKQLKYKEATKRVRMRKEES